MRIWTPSIVPGGHDQTVYMVMEHLGQLGMIWPEAEVEKFDLKTVMVDLLDGQYKTRIGVIAFNTAEQWSRNVSEGVELELAPAQRFRRPRIAGNGLFQPIVACLVFTVACFVPAVIVNK